MGSIKPYMGLEILLLELQNENKNKNYLNKNYVVIQFQAFIPYFYCYLLAITLTEIN